MSIPPSLLPRFIFLYFLHLGFSTIASVLFSPIHVHAARGWINGDSILFPLFCFPFSLLVLIRFAVSIFVFAFCVLFVGSPPFASVSFLLSGVGFHPTSVSMTGTYLPSSLPPSSGPSLVSNHDVDAQVLSNCER